MILIEFEGGKTQKFRMEFHPLVTVVDGFNDAQRRDLAARIQAALTGVEVGFDFNIDIAGRVGPLNDEAIEILNTRNVKLDNIMRASHLPGVKTPAVREASAPDFAQIEEARAELEKAQQRLTETEIALERARSPRSPVESNVVEQLTAAHDVARSQVGDLRIKLDTLPLDDTGEERDRRIIRLELIAQAIRDRIKELRVLIDRLLPPRGMQGASDIPSPVELAQAWLDIEAKLENEDNQPQRAPRWLVESARADLEAARQRVEELKASNDTLAMPKAQQDLLEAQEVWSEVESGEVNSVEQLREQRADLYSLAVGVIGHEVETIDLVHALRSIPVDQPPMQAPNPERDRLQRDLAAAILDHQDVLHEIRELRSVEVIEPTAEEKALRKQFQSELDDAELREAELGERLAELQVAARRVPLPNPSMIAIVSEERDRAFSAVSAAANKLDQLTAVAQSQGPAQSSAKVADAQLDYSAVTQDEVEVFVLSRVAWLRQSANGESIPLIIDGAFDHLPVTLQLRLLNLLGSIASTVQVIYLASSQTAIDWAKRQNELVAAVVQLERL